MNVVFQSKLRYGVIERYGNWNSISSPTAHIHDVNDYVTVQSRSDGIDLKKPLILEHKRLLIKNIPQPLILMNCDRTYIINYLFSFLVLASPYVYDLIYDIPSVLNLLCVKTNYSLLIQNCLKTMC
jgi:hypothetical protein